MGPNATRSRASIKMLILFAPKAPRVGLNSSSTPLPIAASWLKPVGARYFAAINQQAAQMDDFADCILSGRNTPVPGELGRRDLQIITAIYEAARTGKRVKVKA